MENLLCKKTKIVATIGPKTDDVEKIKELIIKGCNVFRLNTSHADMNSNQKTFDNIKQALNETKRFCAIMIDLQGPKIRIGNLKNDIALKKGDRIIFAHLSDRENIIPVDYEGISKDLSKKDKILLDDGKIQAIVDEIKDEKVFATVATGGILKSRKGLNIPKSTPSIEAITPKDIEYINFAVKNKADYIALSFVRKKEDIILAKKYINDLGYDIPVIAKIEKPEAIENLEEIIIHSDALMVARGDLGIELSPVNVPICQKKIIELCNKYKKPVIVATQMLENMINEPMPTRAESSDIANAIIDGGDAIMLSGETSIGNYAPQAVQTMSDIAINTEQSDFYKYDIEDSFILDKYTLTSQAIAFGVDKMLKYVNAKAILSFSHFGNSTKLISKLKPKTPILLISDNIQTCQKMALCWGVFPYLKNWDEVFSENILINIDNFLINEIGLKENDYVIITGSAPKLITGRTNFIRVHRIKA